MKLLPLSTAAPGHVRSRLRRDLILLVLATVAVLVGVNALLFDGLRRDLAESRIASATALVRDEVRNLLGPVEQQLLIARDGLRTAGLTPADRLALDQRLVPILTHMPQIAGAVYAADSGAEWFLRRDGNDWLVRERAPGDVDRARVTRLGPTGEPLETRDESLAYDPRTRPWYRIAQTAVAGQPAWTAPYVFSTLGDPGISASVAWQEAGQTRVLALDVTLERITRAIAGLDLGGEGRGFLFRGDGGVFSPLPEHGAGTSHSGDEGFFSAEARLGGSLHFDAVSAWAAAGRPTDRLVRFQSGGQGWWGGFLPLSGEAHAAWVGVTIPVSATAGVLQGRWQVVVLTALTILGLGLWMAQAMVRKYSRQLRDLPKLNIDRADPDADLYRLLARGEGTHLEFKSTLRTNLRTGKPGKEIELAWLKGVAAFLNTEGGILLLGVADDGTLVGLGADGFDSEDKCRLHLRHLLNHHLGPEHARLVRLALYTLEGQQVGALECERAETPTFLRNGATESFLIRSGPSNLELSVSQALQYVRGRF